MNPSNSELNLPSPPAWADYVLRLLLGRDHGEAVSGDLLEEYRDNVYPSRGARSADVWFVRQVAGFASRATGLWAIAVAVVQLARDMLDWYLPPLDYTMRSLVTTYVVAGIFIALGCWHAWKTRSLRSTACAAGLTGVTAAALKLIGIVLVITIWPDTRTELSGGTPEALELPWLIILPATVLAIAGGLIGKAAAGIFRPKSFRPSR